MYGYLDDDGRVARFGERVKAWRAFEAIMMGLSQDATEQYIASGDPPADYSAVRYAEVIELSNEYQDKYQK